MTVKRRHLLSLTDLSDDELRYVVNRGQQHAGGAPAGSRPLDGAVVGIYFQHTSTRTRSAFSVGALRLGASIVTYGPGDLQENTGESPEDTRRVLSRMLDGLVVRSALNDNLPVYAAQDRMSVINAMTGSEHPTQALADLITLQQRFGSVDGVRMLYVGEGNNTAIALALALTRFPRTELCVVTPPGYEMDAGLSETAMKQAAASGSTLVCTNRLDERAADYDVVYTTRWQTTGTSKTDPGWRSKFEPYQVTEGLLAAHEGALFMHDLPAHRGEEVVAEVLDGEASVAFDQAENKLHSATAVLEWCVGGHA